MRKEKDTTFILNELNSAKSLSEGMKKMSELNDSFTSMSFSDYFNEFLGSHQRKSLSDIVRDSGLSRQYAYDVINGKKNANRDKIIALCLSANMNLEETKHSLIYAGHNELYSRNKRDATIILVINAKQSGSKDYPTVTDVSIFLEEKGFEPLDI